MTLCNQTEAEFIHPKGKISPGSLCQYPYLTKYQVETLTKLTIFNIEMNRFETAISRFDELNSKDPNKIIVNGDWMPKELHDAIAMSRWIDTLYPNASEAVRLAARCQHICRWEKPRSNYPEGRSAYLQWRNDLKKFHADLSEKILKALGYDNATIETVRTLNLKNGLHKNPEVQSIEDALCLVFLETQLESYISKWPEDKTVEILRKTWAKMSQTARDAALKLEFSQKAAKLIHQALDV